MRRAARVDANQAQVVKALRNAGATVQPLHLVGQGCPDLLVGWQGMNLLIEVKDGDKIPSKQRLTPIEAQWHLAWGGQVAIINSIEAAIALLNSMERLSPGIRQTSPTPNPPDSPAQADLVAAWAQLS